MTYDTFDRAARRVENLKRAGIWPGIITRPDGYQLTYDPGDPTQDGDQ